MINIFNKISDTINKAATELKSHSEIPDDAKMIVLDNDITINVNDIIIGNFDEYTNMSPYINLNDAKIIYGMLKRNETVLSIIYIKQKINNKEFIMVLTDNRIIIMNSKKYTVYNYNDITKLDIINDGFMSKLVDFNDIELEFDADKDECMVAYNIIKDINYRNNYIMEKKKYLCGIIPVYQKLNKIGSGISIDKDNNIVFHNRKINNYKCRYEDILNYEVMEDNTSVLKKKVLGESHGFGFVKKECNKMSFRVTLVNNQVFELDLLEPTVFNSTINHMDSNYIINYNFAKEIVEKLDSMNPKNYY